MAMGSSVASDEAGPDEANALGPDRSGHRGGGQLDLLVEMLTGLSQAAGSEFLRLGKSRL